MNKVKVKFARADGMLRIWAMDYGVFVSSNVDEFARNMFLDGLLSMISLAKNACSVKLDIKELKSNEDWARAEMSGQAELNYEILTDEEARKTIKKEKYMLAEQSADGGTFELTDFKGQADAAEEITEEELEKQVGHRLEILKSNDEPVRYIALGRRVLEDTTVLDGDWLIEISREYSRILARGSLH